MQLRKAARKKAKMRLGLGGPSGSGKTFTALNLAYGITGDWEKIAIIDTEHESADLYDHLGPFNVLPIKPPYAPEKYIEAIQMCVDAGIEVAIIDSITHEWSGKGGCLDIHQEIVEMKRAPNSFAAWAMVTPRHQAFIDAILGAPIHIITTVRTKTDYVMQEKNGKQVPTKVGLASITRDGFEYELTASLDIDQEHKAMASKDRTGLFVGKRPRVLSEKDGKMLIDWCEKGIDPVREKQDAIRTITLRQTLDEYYLANQEDIQSSPALHMTFMDQLHQIIGNDCDACPSLDGLRQLFYANQAIVSQNEALKLKFDNRKIQLEGGAKQPEAGAANPLAATNN